MVAPHEKFVLMLRQLWPVKADMALAEYAGVRDRTARSYRNGEREPPLSVLWMLLRSREGYRVLSFIMADDPPDWWLVFQNERQLAALALNIFKQLEGAVKQ